MNRTARAVSVTLALAGLPLSAVLAPQPSVAQWSDNETASSPLTAAALPAPTFDSCSNTAGNITITWHYTTTSIPNLTATNMQWSASNGVLQQLTNIITPSNTSTTGPNTADRYQTTITAGALSNVVSLSSFVIQSQTALGNWTALSTNSAQGVSTGLIGLGTYTCTLT
ncbi:hypothetical protein KZI27_00660 (plasmid) [Curtobacterium sp. TC1]|uniref:hypothetical protein n=1 Tax=Curtobacterium sp. TC1 TaxID=2862880 RepID=UPI001C9B89A1|nr:hypothetical protein [Curtobacterium sp. TC1]QZQ53631.1 hypothetical protein KZI27_00660 [Curtobacterium sp. TC1]